MKLQARPGSLKKYSLSAALLLAMTPLIQAQSLTNTVLYSTDFHNSSTGYIYTTNGATGSGGPVVYNTNRFGDVTEWATVTTGQDGWVSSATPNAPSAQ